MNRVDLGVIVGNDVIFNLTLTYADRPLNLANYTIKIYVKATQTSPDPGSPTYTPVTVQALAGTCTWTLPHANNAVAGTTWYRVDAVDGSGKVGSCLCGTLTASAA
jgi:hypothetical protein